MYPYVRKNNALFGQIRAYIGYSIKSSTKFDKMYTKFPSYKTWFVCVYIDY